MRDFRSDNDSGRGGSGGDASRRDAGGDRPMTWDEFVRGLQELARRAAKVTGQ